MGAGTGASGPAPLVSAAPNHSPSRSIFKNGAREIRINQKTATKALSNLPALRQGGRVPLAPLPHLLQSRGAHPLPPRLYFCRRCGKGLFPFDRDAGLTTRDLTPALERVATLAGAVADSFEKAAELLEEMAGARLSESTVERTTEDAGRRLAAAGASGATFGPKGDWPWHKDYDGRRCAYVELDATGVRQ